MENIGALAILLAFCLAVYAVIGSVLGKLRGKPFLIVSAERAIYTIWFLLTLASGILIYSLITGDFRISYVTSHSNKAMPVLYKFAAWWGGQEGSLLLWAWLLSTYTAVVVFMNRRKFRDMMPYVTAILSTTLAFFLILVTFVASPFKMLGVGKGIVSAADIGDGRGLDPLLQYWTMAIHPPMLYLGYVGFTVPFAFAIASLITKQKGEAWIYTTRRWTLVTWIFQTTGILLGMGWAYSVLGWGGYWGWDPVENASVLPWISATAFLHSVMMQEKRGMLKVWNVVMIATTFFLCIFGTFLTRSGIVQSVHAFSQGTIGKFFVTFLAIGIAATIYLILDRLKYLKSEARLESVLSRESAFLFNNLILLASCFAVLWGTLFPVLSEAFTGEKISVDKPFFNRINVPIALFLLFLTGVGPLIAWRRSSFESLRRAFQWPALAAIALMILLGVLGIYEHPYAMVSLGLCLFVAVTVGMEFFKGANAIYAKAARVNTTKARVRAGGWAGGGVALFFIALRAFRVLWIAYSSGTLIWYLVVALGGGLLFGLMVYSWPRIRAIVELTHRNTRRYGGYVVHMGFVLIIIGFTGAAFNKDKTVEVAKGSTFDIGRYTVKVVDRQDGENDNYVWSKLTVDAYVGDRQLGTLVPERRFFKASRSQVSEVSIRRRLNEDLYLNYAGESTDSKRAVIQAYVNPLVSWIWIGYWVMLAGTLICLVPAKVKLAYARTQIVGITKKHVTVEK